MTASRSTTRTPTGFFLTGRDLWQQVYSRLGPGPGRVAAIAYLGMGAPSLLGDWGKGDLIVCDASDKALKSGSTHPHALKEFLRRGVDVRSCGSLHAKVIASPRAAVVGSMGVSCIASTRSAHDVRLDAPPWCTEGVTTSARTHLNTSLPRVRDGGRWPSR